MREGKTRYAILGLLARSPMSGYDIKKHISDSLAYFWSEGYGRIYPVLGELLKEGLVTRAVQRQGCRPDRHLYTITDEGLAAFERWLAEPPEPAKHRIETLMKMMFGHFGPVSDTIAHVGALRAQQEGLLQYYDAVAQGVRAEYPDDPNVPYWLLTMRCGVRVSRALIEWCDEAEAALVEMSKQGEEQ